MCVITNTTEYEAYKKRLTQEALKKAESENAVYRQPSETSPSDSAMTHLAVSTLQTSSININPSLPDLASAITSVFPSSFQSSKSASSNDLDPTSQLSDRQNWITPEEQLERLSASVLKAAFSKTSIIFDIRKIVASYLVDQLDPSLTNWHTALRRLKALPKKHPPLPWNIHQILDSKCPVYGDQLKPDRTHYKIKDTHILYLIPGEFATLHHLEENILKPYGAKTCPKGDTHPFQFASFVHKEHGDAPFLDTHWVLMTKDILPGSREKTWKDQVAIITTLKKKAFTAYDPPTLQESYAAILLHKVATGQSLFVSDRYVYTCTRVQEMVFIKDVRYHLSLGGFSYSGIMLNTCFTPTCPLVGIAAVRRFYT